MEELETTFVRFVVPPPPPWSLYDLVSFFRAAVQVAEKENDQVKEVGTGSVELKDLQASTPFEAVLQLTDATGVGPSIACWNDIWAHEMVRFPRERSRERVSPIPPSKGSNPIPFPAQEAEQEKQRKEKKLGAPVTCGFA